MQMSKDPMRRQKYDKPKAKSIDETRDTSRIQQACTENASARECRCRKIQCAAKNTTSPKQKALTKRATLAVSNKPALRTPVHANADVERSNAPPEIRQAQSKKH